MSLWPSQESSTECHSEISRSRCVKIEVPISSEPYHLAIPNISETNYTKRLSYVGNIMTKRKIAVMQPYFLPYIGYFQLINQVDIFVITDDYQYSKESWINRNRIINNFQQKMLTIPIEKSSIITPINQKKISSTYDPEGFERIISNAYHKTKYYAEIFPLVNSIFSVKKYNLCEFLIESLSQMCNFLEIPLNLQFTSSFNLKNTLSGQEKIIEICRHLQAAAYINLPGGRSLYESTVFSDNKIELEFIQPKILPYPQLINQFIPNLSVIDLLFNVGKKEFTQTHLPSFNF